MIKQFRGFALLLAAVAVCAASISSASDVYLNAQMPWHPVVLDAQGKVVPWYHPEKNLGIDHVLHLAWDFLEHQVPVEEETGLKVYLTSAEFDSKTLKGQYFQTIPASTFAHISDAMLGWYAYSGDRESIEVVRSMLDYSLAHGLSPKDWEWAQIPFATGCLHDREYGRCLRSAPMAFYGGTETDKIAELALSYVQFYELTGERKYLEAGINCANQLAAHVREGDAFHTPWPYRIDARSGAVLGGEEYGGLVVAAVRLFDELVRLKEGDAVAYKRARDIAWTWIVKNPLSRTSAAWDKWSGYYEDISKSTTNVNDMSSMMTSYYILTQRDPAGVDRDWKSHVGYLLDRSRVLLGRGPFFGAWAIDEQLENGNTVDADRSVNEGAMRATRAFNKYGRPDRSDSAIVDGFDYAPRLMRAPPNTNGGCCSRAGLSCRTSQWAAINAMYFSLTGDGQAREDARRSSAYATYFMESSGKFNAAGGDYGEIWFEDGYGDAARSLLWAMGAMPELAPIRQNHLLRSSSVVQKVSYSGNAIAYRTFDEGGTEVLRVAFRPRNVTVDGARLALSNDPVRDGYTITALPEGDFVLRVARTKGHEIVVN